MEQGTISDEKITIKELLTMLLPELAKNIQIARFVRYGPWVNKPQYRENSFISQNRSRA
jgi:hypothetical protein